MLVRVRMTPRRRPGKKPTRMAGMGNLLQVSVSVVVEFEDGEEVEAGFEVDVAADEVDEEGVAPGARVWSVLITQFPLAQVKPNGQHCDPHVGKLSVRAVVLRLLSGWRVTFCNVMSQGIVLMVLQSLPGQHRRVVLPASGMQVPPTGQQKFEGRPDCEQ